MPTRSKHKSLMNDYWTVSGADVNKTDATGKTALLISLQDSRSHIAQYLIKHGSDVNVVDRLGQSALYVIIESMDLRCVKTVKKLLKAGMYNCSLFEYTFVFVKEWNQTHAPKMVSTIIFEFFRVWLTEGRGLDEGGRSRCGCCKERELGVQTNEEAGKQTAHSQVQPTLVTPRAFRTAYLKVTCLNNLPVNMSEPSEIQTSRNAVHLKQIDRQHNPSFSILLSGKKRWFMKMNCLSFRILTQYSSQCR